MNDESKRKYDNGIIRYKTSMIRPNLCDYSDVYILAKRTTSVQNKAATGTINNTNKKLIFKSCAPFTNCITEINNTQVDDAEHIDIIMCMYNLIEYSDAHSKSSGSLWQYDRDEPALEANNNIISFPADNSNSNSSNFKQQMTRTTGNGGTKNVEITVPLK